MKELCSQLFAPRPSPRDPPVSTGTPITRTHMCIRNTAPYVGFSIGLLATVGGALTISWGDEENRTLGGALVAGGVTTVFGSLVSKNLLDRHAVRVISSDQQTELGESPHAKGARPPARDIRKEDFEKAYWQ